MLAIGTLNHVAFWNMNVGQTAVVVRLRNCRILNYRDNKKVPLNGYSFFDLDVTMCSL